MDYWINLDPILDAGLSPADVLRQQSARVALWTFVEERMSGVRELVATGVEVVPIVPNLPAFVRDITGGGPIKALLRRYQAMPAGMKLTLPVRNIPNLPALAKQDFGMGLTLLAEMELARCMSLGLRRAVLSAAVVDLCVALNNRQAVLRLAALWQKRFRLGMVIETANLGIAASKLVEWGMDTESFTYLSPVNARGYGMRPSREACELVCTSRRVRMVATDVDCAGELSWKEAEAYVRQLGVTTCVRPFKVAR